MNFALAQLLSLETLNNSGFRSRVSRANWPDRLSSRRTQGEVKFSHFASFGISTKAFHIQQRRIYAKRNGKRERRRLLVTPSKLNPSLFDPFLPQPLNLYFPLLLISNILLLKVNVNPLLHIDMRVTLPIERRRR